MAVRWQARVLEAQQRITDARVAEARRETLSASQLYNKALELVQGIGETAEGVRQQAIEGLSRTTLQLADQAMKRSDYNDAKLHIDRVLKVDPRNEVALKMRIENDRNIEENKDKMPTLAALDTLRATETNRIEVARMVQDGKLFYETGRMKEAEEVLRRAIKLDPNNVGASYYLDLVNARRFVAEARLREANSKGMLMEVEREWTQPITRSSLEVPNLYARTNFTQTSPERQILYGKLRSIRLRQWGPIDGLPLSEVIRSLTDEAKRSDLDKKGINLIVSPNADAVGGAAPVAAVDAAGLPVAAGPETTDLNGVSVRLGTTLSDLTLEQILNILTTIADRKIKYSVEDYGIIISPKAAEPVPLHTRFFRVDPNTFQQGLANVTAFSFGESQSGSGGGGGGGRGGGRGGGGGGRGNRGGGGGGFGGGNQNGQNGQQGGGAVYAGVSIAPGGAQGGQQRRQGAGAAPGAQGAGAGAGAGGGGGVAFLTEVTPSEVVIPTVRSFFLAGGVDLSTAGKALFWNDRLGMLMVRGTLQDLDTIEKSIQMLNMSPPEMTIRAKFMEVAQDDSRALGFDWYLGNTLFNDHRIGAQGGSAPSFQNPNGSVANPGGIFPGPSGVNAIAPAATDNLLTTGLRNSAPQVATVTGILTDPQFRFVVRALEQRGGTDLLSAPEITTQSGRQAQIKVVDIRYIVTDLDTDQTAAGQATSVVGSGGGGGIGSLIVPLAEPFEIGPVLDVVPYVNADGYTIQLTILPTLKEFLGYDDPGQFVAQIQGASAGGASPAPLTQPIPLPKFRLRQVATTATVWDGQTVVLGGLIAENVQKTKDKVPVLGDLPFFGRFFRSESNTSSKKNLVIFVTPTLIDPAGNRLHSDEEMPFAKHSLPPAPPAVVPVVPVAPQ